MPLDTHASRSTRQGRVLLIGASVVVIAAVAAGVSVRALEKHAAATWSAERAVPVVETVLPGANGGPAVLTLPAQLAAWNAAPIYPRVSGYVKSWSADIGATVRKGQRLALIDTPELDQDIARAKADLATARANRRLAAVTAERWRDLLASDAVSRQEADEKEGDLAARTAAVDAAAAAVQRLEATKAFAQVVAPFDGTVTARNVDIGDLVNAGAGGQRPLFTVASVGALRAYVQAPQIDSARIVRGMSVLLTLPDQPGRTFTAKVASTSGAINEQSGALLVELEVDNRSGLLRPGSYAEARFEVPAASGALRLPASALIFRAKGLQAALVDASGKVRLRSIRTGRDLGGEVEVLSGVAAGDRVIINPPDSLEEGDAVRLAAPAKRGV